MIRNISTGFLALITTTLLLTSCSSIRVSSDFDREASFDSYKTFNFTENAKSLDIPELVRTRLLREVSSAMAAEGFTESETPDLLVDLVVKTEQKTEATASTYNDNFYGPGYGYRWGPAFSTTTIDVTEYVEGTLFVDFIDAGENRMVWQGRATKTIDFDASAIERDENVKEAVEKIFSKYPPVIK